MSPRLPVTADAAGLIEPLRLRELEPFACGRERMVFRHPNVAGLAVKVMRPDHLEAKWGSAGRWYRRQLRIRHYSLFLRELREYLILRVRIPAGELPVARIFGLAETDFDLGLVTELVQTPAGDVAPTLAALLERDGPQPHLRDALEQFGRQLLAHNIVVNDISATNLVVRGTDQGAPQLVLVDGFGDKNLIPLLSMSGFLNRRNTMNRIGNLLASLSAAPSAAGALVAPRRTGV